MQIIAAVRGVSSGTAGTVVTNLLDARTDWPEAIAPLVEQLRGGVEDLAEAVAFVKEQGGTEYMDLYGRKLVDMAITLVVGALFCDAAVNSDKKLAVARRWLADKMPELRMNKEMILSGDRSVISDFETLAGPVPTAE